MPIYRQLLGSHSHYIRAKEHQPGMDQQMALQALVDDR